MNEILQIRKPVESEYSEYLKLFDSTLQHKEDFQNFLLSHIKRMGGKRVRPLLTMLVAKAVGEVTQKTLLSAVALELVHTASLVHDDVVDKSEQRRGQKSLNSLEGNKVAVLMGDYILSTALLTIASSDDIRILSIIAELGRTLSDGEILQLDNDTNLNFSYDTYYKIIEKKTAALFEACCEIGVISSSANEEGRGEVMKNALLFGKYLGIIFQIRDDIFDYLPSEKLGKPAARDMKEGKLTLPALYVLNVSREKKVEEWAEKVKKGTISDEEISLFIDFIIANNGIVYAEAQMKTFADKAHEVVENLTQKEELKHSLHLIVDYFSQRTM
ncbi:MAG: polyprenyl synthetase family protein [Bacteroidaceae bacterium]|nr:polyprenyl synthetase family protein [Bacteroidaceae bacterium]